jgi:hypothetical protein
VGQLLGGRGAQRAYERSIRDVKRRARFYDPAEDDGAADKAK